MHERRAVTRLGRDQPSALELEEGGVPDERLIQEIRAMLPPGTQVRSGQAQAKEDAEDTNEFISFLQTFLLSFGGIALFVGPRSYADAR